jgi:hypothetical protein
MSIVCMTANDELEIIWKEAVVAYSEVISPNLCRETKENHGMSRSA